MSFRRRDYPELLDNLLTALVGGIAAEPHPFPPPGDQTAPRHLLDSPPARLLVSIFGERNALPYRFRPDADAELSRDGTAVLWRAGGARPDPGTLVHINYLRRDEPATLTDIEVGGVARTLVEAVGHELARLYAQLEAVRDAGFLESATGSALDKVVALLGIQRVPADRATAGLEFARAAGTPGAITIPAGTRVIDPDVQVEYETVETVTLAPAQTRVRVDARDVEPANDPVEAGMLTVLVVPIAGIAAVSNPAPARRAAAAESDAELRTRARTVLEGSEKATRGALSGVLARQLVHGEISEPPDQPGTVVITPVAEDLTPERREQLTAALRDTRAAGVTVELTERQVPARVLLEVEVTTGPGLLDTDRAAAHETVRGAIEDYFAALPIAEDARVNQIVGRVLAVPAVQDVTLLSAQVEEDGVVSDRLDRAAGIIALADTPTVLAELSISDAGLPTRADLVIRFPTGESVPDRTAVTTALEDAFTYLTAQAALATSGPERVLSYGKLLRVLPDPVGEGATLTSFDTADEPKPPLPTSADPYDVTLFVAQANGLTRILGAAGDSYTLSTRERLALQTVTVEAEG